VKLKDERAMAVRPNHKKRDRAARERALILAGTKLFAARGFEATTTREIAAKAGCAEGLIHRYFKSKAGLLMALVHWHLASQVADLRGKLPFAPTLEDEVLQLVNWEMERMWQDRDFLRVVIPRALVDPALGELIISAGPLQHARAIAERLKTFEDCRELPEEEIEALAHFIKVTGFMFGFMRPVVLRQQRDRARRMAMAIAAILLRGFQPLASSEIPQVSSA
jgi:AcrR family transcriptional regulator